MRESRFPTPGYFAFHNDIVNGYIQSYDVNFSPLADSGKTDNCKWETVSLKEQKGGIVEQIPAQHRCRIKFQCMAPFSGTYYFECGYDDYYDAKMPLRLTINGRKSELNEESIHRTGYSPSWVIELAEGKNTLILEADNTAAVPRKGGFFPRIIEGNGTPLLCERSVQMPELQKMEASETVPDITDFTAAVGGKISSCGRFGFTASYGFLDCSMPEFGTISKPYLWGDPRYRKNLFWNFSFLPPGISDADKKHLGSRWKNYKPCRGKLSRSITVHSVGAVRSSRNRTFIQESAERKWVIVFPRLRCFPE